MDSCGMLWKYKYKFYYVENEKRIPDGILNGNAFKDPDSTILSAARNRLAIFIYHYNVMQKSISLDIDRLYERTSDPKSPIDDLSELLVKQGAVAIYDGVSYQTAIHGLLYSLKSFLDVFSFFIAKYLNNEAKGISFGKGKVSGTNISGGSLINWLRNTKFESFHKTEELSSLIEKNSIGWINQAIEYRDDLTHRVHIAGFKDMHVVLEPSKPYIRKENIIVPSMPDGTPLNAYAEGLLNSLISFMKDIVELLPDVDIKKLNFDMSLSDRDSTMIRIEYDDGKDKKPALKKSRT